MANQSEDVLKSMRNIAGKIQDRYEKIKSKLDNTDQSLKRVTLAHTSLENNQKDLSSKYSDLKSIEIPSIENTMGSLRTDINSATDSIKKSKEDFTKDYNYNVAEFKMFLEESKIKINGHINDIIKEIFENENKSLLNRIESLENKNIALQKQIDDMGIDEDFREKEAQNVEDNEFLDDENDLHDSDEHLQKPQG